MEKLRIHDYIHPARIACLQACASKKSSLEMLGTLLADSTPDLNQLEIFDSLLSRERLGSTGLGNGVALPHGRIQGLKKPLCALLTLENGVDFDATDKKPVDIMFALIVPEESTDDHLQLLAEFARLFSQQGFCSHLRKMKDADECYEFLQGQEQQSMSA
ncbi:MAG: PTS sugar transporter subunit IIA [Gammaproteobacteria bacterium]